MGSPIEAPRGSLHPLFQPRAIAVYGASSDPTKIGGRPGLSGGGVGFGFNNFLINGAPERSVGAHGTPAREFGLDGTRFAVWAPNAQHVAVITARTGWECEFSLERANDGTWETFLPHVGEGDAYRFVITGADGNKRYKADPYAFTVTS